MKIEVKVVVYDDGEYSHTFPTDLSVQHKGKFAWNGECDK